MFKQTADIQTADMLKLPVPKANYHNVVLKPSAYQVEMVKDLSERAERVRNRMVDSSVDNMLLITNDGRKLALDQRLMNPMLPDDENGKVSACAKNVFEIWHKTAEQKSTQMVFCDLSTPHNDGNFNVYDGIRDKLLDMGIPKDQIAYIHNAASEAQKKELFGKVRSGEIRVLIGSTQKMGAGTNVQKMFNCDCPDGFRGHSLSVSDVVEIVGDKDAGFYFCDSIGFQRVEFDPDQAQELDTGMLRVVLVEPGKVARVAEIDGSLEGMQKTVGGYIQAVYPFEETVCLVCNEEGKLQGLPLNRALRDEDNSVYDIVAGTFFVCDCSTENFKSLNEEQLKRYTEKYKRPERFMRVDDQILAIPMPIKSDKERER